MSDVKEQPRLRQHYDAVVRKQLAEEFGYSNPMEVPKLEKIVINMGVGESTTDSKKAQVAANDLALIAGQKPVVTKAKKAIAGFKIREGQAIGCMVTLRGVRKSYNLGLPTEAEVLHVDEKGSVLRLANVVLLDSYQVGAIEGVLAACDLDGVVKVRRLGPGAGEMHTSFWRPGSR